MPAPISWKVKKKSRSTVAAKQGSITQGVFRLGVRQKMLLALVSVLIVSTNVVGWLSLKEMERTVLEGVQQRGDDISSLLVELLPFDIVGYDYHTIKLLLDRIVASRDIMYAQVTNNRGTIMAEAGRAPLPEQMTDVILIQRDVYLDNEVIGSLKIGLDTSHIGKRLMDKRTTGIGREIIMVVVIAIVEFIALSIIIFRPIATIASSLRENLDERGRIARDIPIQSHDEFGELATAFNEMRVQLNEATDNLHANIDAANAELIVKNQQLEQSAAEALRATEAKSLFLANMSHELRTPLNAIIGYTGLLTEEAQERGHQYFLADLERIRMAGVHLLSLINDILDITKIESGKMELLIEKTTVGELIDYVFNTTQPLVKAKGNRFVVTVPDRAYILHVDVPKLRQSLINLVGNAAKFTENGTVSFSAQVIGEQVRFEVRDTGIGINAEAISRLFQAFQQADPSTTRKYGGTGLGLAITKRYCQMLGGDITVESETGKGSLFTVFIPADCRVKSPLAPAELETH